MTMPTQKNLIEKLADAGEDALTKLAGTPGAHRVLESMTGATKRLDDMQKRLRSLAEVEKKVAQLERRVAKLESAARTSAPARRPSSARKASPTATRAGEKKSPKPSP
jgi:hypothetical protein